MQVGKDVSRMTTLTEPEQLAMAYTRITQATAQMEKDLKNLTQLQTLQEKQIKPCMTFFD